MGIFGSGDNTDWFIQHNVCARTHFSNELAINGNLVVLWIDTGTQKAHNPAIDCNAAVGN
jgi:hypothetical protein